MKGFYTDTELLEGLAAGRSESVTLIYRLYYTVLAKWMLSRGGLEADAQDVFQEALVILYEKAKSPEFCLTCRLSTYLFAVSKRLWLKKIERSAAFSAFDVEDEERHPGAYDEDISWHEEKELQFSRLDAALSQLGEPCASLLRAFYVEKMNMQEIAGSFHYTNAENAKTQKYKCLSRLKKIFFTAESGMKVKSR